MSNQYFLFEHRHCGKTWHGLHERSRCRSCGEWSEAWCKALVSGPESVESFRKKIREVLKRG